MPLSARLAEAEIDDQGADPLPQNVFVAGYDGGSFFIERRWKEMVARRP